MGNTTYTYLSLKGNRFRYDKYTAVQAEPIDYTKLNNLGKSMRIVLSSSASGPWASTVDYEGTVFWQESNTNYGWAFSSTGPNATFPTNEAYKRAYAKAYGKFMDACFEGGERSQMLTNLAERHETFEMVLSRMSQILKGARQLKTGDFRGFCKTFGVKPKQKHKDTVWSRPRDFSALWLEYWFGWAPTVADLNNAFEVYGREMSDPWIIAKSSSMAYIGNRKDGVSSSASANGYTMAQTDSGTVRVRLSGKVSVDNNTLFELNKLGLINPISTAYELIPFSWFAGWFGNIAQVLGQSTDLVGLKLQELSLSVKAEWTHSYAMSYQGANPGSVSKSVRQEMYTRGKLTTLPRVSLVWKIPSHLSPTRGATLASLIVQIFAPAKK